MLEIAPQRKNKINLSDYNSHQDIESKILLSECSSFEFEVLEAILFSSLKIATAKLAHSLDVSEEALKPVLEKLARTNLLEIQGNLLLVDKERRKYFEFQICRFEKDFKQNMDFLQGLLKMVPIHILPVWYSIPRSSNNIFESIVEKYLFSPQIYERYLEEVEALDPVYSKILKDLFSSENLQIPSSVLIAKHGLTRFEFEEVMLQLEFRFVAFVCYRPDGNQWQEWVVPFYEWQQHLLFLKNTQPPPIIEGNQRVSCKRNAPFAFLKDMEIALELLKKNPLTPDSSLAPHFGLSEEDPFTHSYIMKLFEKLVLIRLAAYREGSFVALDGGTDWLSLSYENRAVALYRHPQNRPADISERQAREAEKIVKRVIHGKCVLLDDLLTGSLVFLSDDPTDKRPNKNWLPPKYNESEKSLIKTVLLDSLFECGMVLPGIYEGRDCLAVTPFGKTFFED